ncbi:MAG: hypothetical protein ACREHD_16995 [Pirellulales bacterium]
METGLFDFRNRVFQCLAGVFLQHDPVGYLGGATLFEYAQSAPIFGVDPFGELVVNPLGNTAVPACGKPVQAEWDFFLDVLVNPANPRSKTGAPCNGFIVQKVDVFCSINNCGSCTGNVSLDELTYWEAWPVRKGQKKSLLRKSGTGTDTAQWTPPIGTCGSYLQSGEIRFYCARAADDPTGNRVGTRDLSSLWTPGTYGKLCPTSSGILPSTGNPPAFWARPSVDGPAQRGFAVDWVCCKPKSSVTLVVTPRKAK